MPGRQNILIIHLDFPRWRVARSWSYETQLGFNEGLSAYGCNVTTLINNRHHNSGLHESWFRSVRELVGSRKFDQVWAEVVHSEYSDDYLDFLAGLAPIRLAMIGESLRYTEEEYGHAPVLRSRCAEVKKRLEYFTHVLSCDEKDADDIEVECGIKTLWWVLGLPSRSIATAIEPPVYDQACFSGPVYGARGRFLAHPELSRLMLHLPPLEKQSKDPLWFDLANLFQRLALTTSPRLAAYTNHRYVETLCCVRQRMFDSWLHGLKRGLAVVQLPHFVKAFPGRVYEGMAAGRPVITMALQDRPRTMGLFEPGKEILFYQHGPEEVIELIKRLQTDQGYGLSIAENAAQKLRSRHTLEQRVRQILCWIEVGELPDYC